MHDIVGSIVQELITLCKRVVRVLCLSCFTSTCGSFHKNFAIFPGNYLTGLAAWLISGRSFLGERHVDELEVTLVVFASTWVALILYGLMSHLFVLIVNIFGLQEYI